VDCFHVDEADESVMKEELLSSEVNLVKPPLDDPRVRTTVPFRVSLESYGTSGGSVGVQVAFDVHQWNVQLGTSSSSPADEDEDLPRAADWKVDGPSAAATAICSTIAANEDETSPPDAAADTKTKEEEGLPRIPCKSSAAMIADQKADGSWHCAAAVQPPLISAPASGPIGGAAEMTRGRGGFEVRQQQRRAVFFIL